MQGWVAFCVGVVLATTNVAFAESRAERYDIHIVEVRLGAALTALALQTDKQLFFPYDLADAQGVHPVSGNYTVDEALDLMLRDTGFSGGLTDSGVITISRVASTDSKGRAVKFRDEKSSYNKRKGLLGVLVAVFGVGAGAPKATDANEEELEQELEEIVVTGTYIRGIAPESSPTRMFTREDVQISGAATAQDFIQTLPSNFEGGPNPDLPFGSPTGGGGNGGLGASVNLRGLGAGATLVLLNGRRIAPSSNVGDVVDISMIPASAIERVEVLTDGASSIYGSDAVAGVVNFILRDDFDGVEGSFRYGIGTQNASAEELRTGLSAGTTWNSGNALLAYEYFNQDQISAQDRAFSQGVPLPNFLQPSQERQSILGTISQDFSTSVGVFADVSFSRRESRFEQFDPLVGGVVRLNPTSENINVSAGGFWKFGDSWTVDFSGTYSHVNRLSDSLASQPSRSEADTNVWVGDLVTSGTLLDLPGGELKLALGGQFRAEDILARDVLADTVVREADRKVYAVFGEVFIPVVSPDNSIGGIERLEINMSGRLDDYSDFGSTVNPKVGVLWSPVVGLNLRGSYSTSFVPPALGIIGNTRNQAAAFNTSVLFAFFGLTPADSSLADVVLLELNGTSPSLDAETSRAFTAGIDFSREWGPHGLNFAATWFDIEFKDRLGRTPCPVCSDENPRDAVNVAFNNPDAFPDGTIIFNPTREQITEAVNNADQVLANIPPIFGDPFDAAVISNILVTRNLALTRAQGLDFDATYSYDSSIGDLVIGVDISYLSAFDQQAGSTSPTVSQLNTLYNPVDLNLRGRLGYINAGFSANAFLNYVDSYLADNSPNAELIDSWTTVDLNLAYDFTDRSGKTLFDNTVFRLSVINVFDQDPPAAASISRLNILGYDPTNASPLGRFIAIEVTKRF